MKWRKQAMSAVLTGCLAAGMLAPAALAAEPQAEVSQQKVQQVAEAVLEKQSAYNDAYLLTQSSYYVESVLDFVTQYDYVYDKYGQVKKMTEHLLLPGEDDALTEDPSEQVTTVYTYDANGNVTREESPNELYVYQYNAAGDLTKETYTDKKDKENNYSAVYTYTSGRVTKVTTTFPNLDNLKLVMTVSYDTNGNVSKKVISYEGEAIEQITYSYDANGNCISMKDDIFDGMPEYTSFDYDENNNCVRETSGDDRVVHDYELVTDWRAAHPSTVDKLFDDVAPTAWYYTYVQNAYDMNLMEGVDNTHFNPNKTLNRATLVQIMYNEAGRPAVTGKTGFTDVKEGQWYYKAVLWAEQNKVTSGIGGGKFGPTSPVSREQMVTILYNYEKKPEADRTVLEKYPDADQIHDWAMDGMAWAVGEGVIVGDQQKDGSVYLNPRKTATRAQAAVVLSKYFAEKK